MHTKLHRVTHAKVGNFCERSQQVKRSQRPKLKTCMGGNFLFFGYGATAGKKTANRPFVKKMQVSANWPLASRPPPKFNKSYIVYTEALNLTAFKHASSDNHIS